MRPSWFPPQDLPLWDDVRLLVDLLDTVLREKGGDTLLHRVEAARRAAIRHRDGEAGAEEELRVAVGGLEPAEALPTMRAFSLFFGLVNMAERIHRVRRLREAERPGQGPPRGSIESVVAGLAADAVPEQAVVEVLRRLSVVPVFTAHPTEATRLAILVKEQRLVRALVDRIERSDPTPPEEEALLARIGEEVRATWETEEHLESKVVADEVEHVAFYLRRVVYRVLPRLHESLESALTRHYGPEVARTADRPFLRFGSWVGGDMDGNPAVGPDTIIATLVRQRELILGCYVAEVDDLAGRLTQSPTRTGIAPEVLQRMAAAEEQLPEAATAIGDRYRDVPYRRLLKLMAARLRATRRDGAGAYPGPGPFADDLRAIHDSLMVHGGATSGGFRVRRLLRRVSAFGFHLATLDLRQDAAVHRDVAGELLGKEGFAELPAAERERLLEGAEAQGPPRSEGARRAVQVMRVVAEARERFGSEAIGPYIVSMAEGPDDALAVLLIARAGGLQDADGNVPLDVVPLFETVADLERARSTMAALLEHPTYSTHLAARGGQQMVMLGYSDSAKDSGIASSRWSLIRAQEELAQLEGMHLTVFHGRGGSASRGGSGPRRAVLAEPPTALDGRLRLTEQGEIIHTKYGLRGIARRTLELTAGAVLEATVRASASDPDLRPIWRDAAASLATASRAAYRSLVHDDPSFPEIFREVTPIDVIERMRIGSRPPSRRQGGGITDLRAIPWVFAWTQTRLMLTGWLGLSEGFERLIALHGLDTARDMARRWPFFRNLLLDVEMVLAKADPDIAARYFELGGPAARALGPRLLDAFATTRAQLLEILQQHELLEHQGVLARAIRLRNPYVDPMNFLQVEMLERWRAGGREDHELERVLFTTVKGIARGLQNTG